VSKFHECNADKTREVCKPESHEFYIAESSKVMDELMELFCPDNIRWGTKECTDVTANAPEPTMPDGTPSLLPAVIDLMKQFTETTP